MGKVFPEFAIGKNGLELTVGYTPFFGRTTQPPANGCIKLMSNNRRSGCRDFPDSPNAAQCASVVRESSPAAPRQFFATTDKTRLADDQGQPV